MESGATNVKNDDGMAGTLKNDDLHRNVPDTCRTILLLMDVINALDFPDNEQLLHQAPTLGKNIAALKRRVRQAGISSNLRE